MINDKYVLIAINNQNKFIKTQEIFTLIYIYIYIYAQDFFQWDRILAQLPEFRIERFIAKYIS